MYHYNMVLRVTSTKRYCISDKDVAACHILSKRPTVKSGAMRDDQSVQNQMRQFTVTLLHIHHAIHYCAACKIISHLSACSIKLQVQALVIHVLA